MSFLDECNFEARHIMRVSGDKSESSNRSHSRRLSEVKMKEISHALSNACSVENLESTRTSIVAMHEQASENSLGRSTVLYSPVTMQNFPSHSQETVNSSIFWSKCYHQFLQFQMILYSLLRLLKHILLFHVLRNICNQA